MSATAPDDVPSPVDLRRMDDARAWAARAEGRPGRAAILDRIAAEAAACGGAAPRILELGSGPGFLAQRILQCMPDVRYTALDFSPAMHELARARLADFLERIDFLERSFKSDDWTAGLQPFDLVVTNQAVHELRHKRYAATLHRQVYGLLRPDGSYLVADHCSGPGGLADTALFMSEAEQADALRQAGFTTVARLLRQGSLALHRARKT